jgi:predicted GIY-YIG superfamily endonuclease
MKKIWTKSKCISIAKKCVSRSDFKKKFSGAWDSAYNNGWLIEVYTYLKNPNNLTIKWTKENCRIICNKYLSYSEFIKNEPKLYDAILQKKWLIELCSHMLRNKNLKGFWTKERCLKESLKYETKTDWMKHSCKSYQAAHKGGWIDYCSVHMLKLSTNQNRAIYSFEFEDNYVYVGLTYSPHNRKKYHLSDKNSSVFKHILKTNLIPEFKILTPFMRKEVASIEEGKILDEYKNKNWLVLNKIKTGGLGGDSSIWIEDKCVNEALKYKTRTEFKKMSGGAYQFARKHGFLEKCCSHMKYQQLPNGYWKNNKEICVLEAKKYTKISNFKINSGGAHTAVIKNGWYKEFKEMFDNEKIKK